MIFFVVSSVGIKRVICKYLLHVYASVKCVITRWLFHVHYFLNVKIAPFEANVIFATGMLAVFTFTFGSNVSKYCTQDLNKLCVYEKCSYSHISMHFVL